MSSFYLVVSPSGWISQDHFLLRAPVDSLVTITDVVEHPRHANLRSFSFDFHDDRCVVTKPAMRAWFDSPSKDNLLYFSVPPVANVIVFCADTIPVWYRRLSETKHPLARRLGILSEQFYCQVETQPPESFTKVHVTDDRPVNGDCWLNPLILKFRANANELSSEENSGLVDRVDQSKVLGLEAAFQSRLQERIDSAQWLSRYLAKLRSEPTVMDGLWRGPEMQSLTQSAKAFTVLDQLGGTFCITTPGAQVASFGWCPPPDASANLLWFARYWQKRWGGQWLANLPSMRPVPAEQICDRSPQLEDCLNLSQSTACLLQEIYQQLATGKSDRHPLSVVNQFVRRGLDLGDDLGRWVRGDSTRPSAHRSLLLDAVGLTDSIARQYLLPASPVRVCFTNSLSIKGGYLQDQLLARSDYTAVARTRYVDPINSFRYGGWEYLSRIVRCESPRSGPLVIDWDFGWWNQFYESLYGTSLNSTSSIRVTVRGFSFRRSRLGHDGLKSKRRLYRQGRMIST